MGREENNERSLGKKEGTDRSQETKRGAARPGSAERAEMGESEVTNEVTEGGLKEIGRRWRGAKEAIAGAEREREQEGERASGAPPLPSSD